MKKIALILALLLTTCVFAACGQTESPFDSGSSGTGSSVSDSAGGPSQGGKPSDGVELPEIDI